MVVDTGIFIEHLRAKEKDKTTLYDIYETGSLFISSITFYELMAGATTEAKRKDILILTKNFQKLDFTSPIALRAATIYQQLKKQNQLIEFRDIFIGATCLEFGFPVVTMNKKHFRRIKGLKLI